jgi:hypothetical protein
MKRFIKPLFVFSLIGLLAGGCELLQGVKFDEGYYYVFTINPTEAGDYDFAEEVITTDIQKVLDDNNIKEKKLKSVIIKEIKATIQPGSHETTFNILEGGTLYMHGENMKTVTVAYWPDPAPQNVSTVILDHNSDEMKDHVLSGKLYFSGVGTLNADHNGITMVRVDVTFELNGKII